jgi:serine/threonine-protein kinase
VPPGSVISLSVKEGAKVPHNTAVTVVVSQGPAPVTVPQVSGTDEASAESTLTGFGLVPVVKEVFDASAPKGEVMSQEPAQSTAAHRGDTVQLVVSKGPEMIVVPHVVGKKTAEAKKELEAAGFKVKVHKFAGGFFDSVRFQDPDGNGSKKAAKGSTVSLTVF